LLDSYRFVVGLEIPTEKSEEEEGKGGGRGCDNERKQDPGQAMKNSEDAGKRRVTWKESMRETAGRKDESSRVHLLLGR
jgi:hypothetical protein